MNKEILKYELSILFKDIDQYIEDLINARINKDEIAEIRVQFTAEHLLVTTQQQIACVMDFLNE